MLVAAVDSYADEYGLPYSQVFARFKEHGAFDALRSSYDVLHTQSLDESAAFVKDFLAKADA